MMCLLLADKKNKLEKETNLAVWEQTESQLAENLKNLALKIETLTENLGS